MRGLGAIWIAVLLSGCSFLHPHRGVTAPIVDTVIAATLAGTAVAISDNFGQPNSAFAQSDGSVALGAIVFVGAAFFIVSAIVGFTGKMPSSDRMVPNQNLLQDGLQNGPAGSVQMPGPSCRSDDDCGAGSSCTGSHDLVGTCIPSDRAR